jgi:hypothetical protein
MANQFGRDQNRFQGQDREWDRSDNRNVWQGRNDRDDRDEDGGWGRNRQDEGWRTGGRDDDERRLGESSSQGQGQRGYGRAIYGESGLGEPDRDERSGYSNRWHSSAGSGARGYGSSGYGSSGGYGQGTGGGYGQGSSGGYGQGTSGGYAASGVYGGYHGLSGGYAGYGQGSSGYSPTGPDRDRFGSQRDQGFRSRDFRGGFAGRGPKGYKRTDERVREDVCDRLSQDDEVDASDISVRVENGEVTLEGSTETRRQKHRAEEIAADVAGVSDVHNNVRVRKSMLSELKDKVTGDDEPTGGHAGSGTRDSASQSSRSH